MQNINYLDITSKLPKLGAKKLYFSLDISAYDGVRLLILQNLYDTGVVKNPSYKNIIVIYNNSDRKDNCI